MKHHKLTRQGVRDLGQSPWKPTRELPEQQLPIATMECPHMELGRDRFGNCRCRDCGAILPKPEGARW